MHERILKGAELKAYLHMSASRKQITDVTKNRVLQVWSQLAEEAKEIILHPDASILPGDGVELVVECGNLGSVAFTVRGDGGVKISRGGKTWKLAAEELIPKEVLAVILPTRRT